ncbi:NAD(P)/FAD-dependent oxidoreductase [Streptomyces sp. NBC_00094]|uniref:NAD(P)/FAD-dependent oxidoreductase n=1 Tax=Streptomyces sp. NBC_00094 TaxID=2903620 RepID=UPI00225113AF|nr:FAD-dependent oxidoreductase [Streptomyces sp. NBC_00094]MCX5389369.1 FAD-dependent oxidoreductase [Streptomyces sp. NBC_00094]
MDRRSVAVVGGGVAGLTAARVLSRVYDVVLYESEGRLGGHAHTHELPTREGGTVRVDTGFIVHNERTYPHLLRLFRELGVATQDSEMSMSVRCDGCGLEYAGARGPRGLLGAGNLRRGTYLRMLADVPRFHRAARRLLATGDDTATLGAFLREHRFSPYFTGHFAIPLVSAVWSCPADTALRFPAAYLFRFLDHHGLLSLTGSPQWKTVTGGSAAYVDRVAKGIASVRTATPVRAIARGTDHARVTTEDGETAVHAAVVIAVHADRALRLLADPTPDERRVLGAFPYSRNPTALHRDTSVLPRSPHARASWNYRLPSCTARPDTVQVSYDMNRLQRLPVSEPHLVTLNADDRLDPSAVLARTVYEHPVFTPESVAAQRELPALRTAVTAYAGAHHGWGFHEDGCRSGVEAARALGVRW